MRVLAGAAIIAITLGLFGPSELCAQETTIAPPQAQNQEPPAARR